ncbi:MAG: TonB-dependent receptor [Bacteroidales bacterium]|nr:TonB-dependent receptor [Bacteroidales bacterium]
MGFFSLPILAGKDILACEYVGYESQSVEITALNDTVINFRLHKCLPLKEAVISAERHSAFTALVPGTIDIPLALINATPALLGESDILKTVQLLPGVQSGTNGFCGLYVRGGGPDENLLLLDGMPLYNAEHLLGLFSVFMPEAVKKVTFYKGCFPARYGGRLSSVLDLRTNDGNTEHHCGEVSVSLLSTKFHIEGPVVDSTTTFSFSSRIMNTILAVPIVQSMDRKEKGDYWFYDIDGKFTHRFSPRDRISFNVYKGRDKLFFHEDKDYPFTSEQISNTITDSEMAWGNTQVRAGWDHVYGPSLSSTAFLGYNRFAIKTDISEDFSLFAKDEQVRTISDMEYKSGMDDVSFNIDFDLFQSNSHHIRFGVESIFHVFSPETYGLRSRDYGPDDVVKSDTTMSSAANNVIRAMEISTYAEDEICLGKALSLMTGIRFNVFAARGRSYLSPQPRLAVKYSVCRGVDLKLGYSRMGQNVHLLTSSRLTLPMDLWVPATERIDPMISDQGSAGAYFSWAKGWQMTIEGYYKMMRNVLEYKDGVPVMGNSSGWEDKVEMGIGRSYGAEILIQKESGSTTGWLSYTIAKTERRFPDGTINRGEWFPYKYDRRHSVNLLANHAINSVVDLSAVWTFVTGGVITIPQRQTVVLDPDGKELQQANVTYSRGNYRLPPSHLLNVGLNWHRKIVHGESIWTVSIYNIYNQMNPDWVISNLRTIRRSSQIYVAEREVKNVTIIPILPSIGYTFKF